MRRSVFVGALVFVILAGGVYLLFGGDQQIVPFRGVGS